MARLAAVALLLALHARAGDVLVNPIVGHEVRLDGGSTPTPKTSNATATALPVVPPAMPESVRAFVYRDWSALDEGIDDVLRRMGAMSAFVEFPHARDTFFNHSVHKFYGLAAGSTVRARAPRRKGQPVAWSDRRAVVVRITPDLKYDLEYVDLDPPEMESVSRRCTPSRLVRGIRRRDGGASLRAEERRRLSRRTRAPATSETVSSRRAAPRPPRRGARRNGRHRGGGAPERAEERFA